MQKEDGYIEIETIAKNLKDSLVGWLFGIGSAWPFLRAILNIPLIGSWVGSKLKEFLTYLVEVGELVPFIFNSKKLTTSQASDYITALQMRDSLPSDVTDEVWERAEHEVNKRFDHLVRYKS